MFCTPSVKGILQIKILSHILNLVIVWFYSGYIKVIKMFYSLVVASRRLFSIALTFDLSLTYFGGLLGPSDLKTRSWKEQKIKI